MMEKLAELIWKILEPRMEEVIEEAYEKGASDIVTKLAFVFDVVRDKAREEGLADTGAIDIDDLDVELSQTIFE